MRAALLAACATLFAGQALAGSTSYSGTFATDDQFAEYTVTSASVFNLDAFTTSYATGGFEPLLSLFSPSGAYLDGAGGNGQGDATLTDPNLAAGTYTVALTQDLNYPVGGTLADGFSQAGAGDYTGTVAPCTGGAFKDTSGGTCAQRTGAYALTISTASAAVPEPGPLGVLAAGLILAGLTVRTRARN